MDESEHYLHSVQKDQKKSIYLGKEVRNNRRKGSAFGFSYFTAALAMMYHCYGTIHLNRKIHYMLQNH